MYSFADVEERLVEAMLVMRRLSDREAGWLRVKASWPDIVREHEAGDYDARGYLGNSSDIALKPLPATRRDIAEMEEAFAWVLAAKEAVIASPTARNAALAPERAMIAFPISAMKVPKGLISADMTTPSAPKLPRKRMIGASTLPIVISARIIGPTAAVTPQIATTICRNHSGRSAMPRTTAVSPSCTAVKAANMPVSPSAIFRPPNA